jgi:protein TonB
VVQPSPDYPSTSRRLGEVGEVHLRVEIDTDGLPRRVSVHRSSGFPRLDESAVAAMRATRFAPYTEHGVALVVWTIVPIEFQLQG